MHPSPGQRGTTFFEVTMMAAMMSVLMIVISQSISGLAATRSELRQQANIGSVGARLLQAVEQDVTYAQRTFGNSADEVAWLQATAIGRGLLQAGHRLPLLTQRGLFDRDPPGVVETGDLLFVATRADRVAELVTGAGGEALAPPVQTYRLVVYAPGAAAGGDDLLRWVSDPLASYWDVEAIADAQLRSDVWAALHQRGLRYAWDPQKPRATGLFAIQAAGSATLLGESKTISGGEDPTLSRTLAMRGMCLAANGSLHGIAVPEFAAAAGSFPGGFEVKLDGNGAGKLVLVRLVLRSTLPHKRQVCGELRRILDTRS